MHCRPHREPYAQEKWHNSTKTFNIDHQLQMAKNRYQCAKMQGYNLKLLKCFKGARNAPVPVLCCRGILRCRTQNYPPPVPSYLVEISLLHILLHIWRLLGVLHTFGRENETFPFCKDFFRVFPPFSLAAASRWADFSSHTSPCNSQNGIRDSFM